MSDERGITKSKISSFVSKVVDVIHECIENEPSSGHPLYSLDPEKISSVPFQNEKIDCRVVSVYDGDTCTVIYFNGSIPAKTNIRLMGIDCPEIRKSSPLEKRAAEMVRDYVRQKIENKIVQVCFIKHDKYGGRIVGEIFVSGESLSQHLIKRGYGRPYDGSKKSNWTQYELEYICSNCK